MFKEGTFLNLLRSTELDHTIKAHLAERETGFFVLHPHVTLLKVFSGPVPFTDVIPPHIQQYIREKRVRIVLFYPEEGEDMSVFCHKFYSQMAMASLPVEQFVFVSGSSIANIKHSAMSYRARMPNFITLFCPIFQDHARWGYTQFPFNNRGCTMGPEGLTRTPPEKSFLCYNRITKEHRLALLTGLRTAGILDSGLWSNGYMAYSGTDMDVAATFKNAEYNFGISIPQEFRQQKILDTPHFEYNLATSSGTLADYPWAYEQTRFSLVTESSFDSDLNDPASMLFITEKTFKPMANHHPFIMVGNACSLSLLRTMGYRTFHPYINEAYDTIIDSRKRMSAIISEATRLSRMSKSEWQVVQTAIADILLHNHKTLVTSRSAVTTLHTVLTNL